MDFSTSAVELMDGFSQLNLEPGQDPIFGLSSEPVPKRLWNDVLKLLVTGESDWESLDEEDKLSLAYYDDKNVSRPTLLHKLIEDPSLLGFEELAIETREKIMLFLLNQLSRYAEKPADPLLTVAISYHRADFIEFILTKQSDLLASLLGSIDGEGKNCLHKAFQSVLLSDWGAHQKRASERLTSTMSTITKLLEHANLTTITAQDNAGNTPIHYAMDYRLCHISATYKYGGKAHGYDKIIRKLLSPLAKNKSVLKDVDVLFNRLGDSPYRYFFRLRDQIHERLKQIMKANAPGSSGKEPKPNAKQTMKEDHQDLVKGPEKHPTGETVDRPSISMKKDFLQTTLSVKTYVRPVLAEPQHRLGSSTTPPDKTKDSEAEKAKLYPLARTSTGFADTIRRKVQPKTSPETTASSNHTKQEASKSGRTVEPFQWPRLETEAAEKLLNYVQCFFIRNCTDRDAKDFLYGRVASDKNLFFDASHLRGKRVDDVVLLIEKLHQAGGFGDTLSYVRIPQLASEIPAILPTQRRNVANEKRQLTKGSAGSASKGRDTLVKVFDKLVEVHVRKVLRLHVEDNADERAHTDAAIERAIRGHDQYSSAGTRAALEIEEWDWCKPDINTDVIKHAAPSVQHIHLHWSGNQAVLYGWASSEHGIPLIWRNPRSLLSNVTLHAYQGLESMERREVMADQFATLVEKRSDKKVKVTTNPVLRSIIVKERPDGEQDPLYGEQFEKPRSDAWIGAMERFRKALLGMHKSGLFGQPSSQPSRVKVALIDDGIDLHEVNHYNNTTNYTGVSYCPSNGRGEDAWWKSTGGHGTIMANMISRINPWVDLEVIKIQSSPSYIHGNGARSIDPRSAADAIDAAIKRKADIISMSWTITDLGYRRSSIYSESPDVEGTKKPAGRIEMDLLREAIERATKNPMERLLICSAADDLRLSGKNTLPYSAASKRILRIGSAGHFADRDPSSGSGNSITFYFPGNQVAEEQRAHSTNPVVYHTGSSVSTALAAGLASLIMYCAHCVHACGAGDEYQSFALRLRDFSCMKDAFSAINRHSKWDDDQKIVPVWGLFGEKADEILADGKTDREKIIVLKNLVKYLCHKLIPETN